MNLTSIPTRYWMLFWTLIGIGFTLFTQLDHITRSKLSDLEIVVVLAINSVTFICFVYLIPKGSVYVVGQFLGQENLHPLNALLASATVALFFYLMNTLDPGTSGPGNPNLAGLFISAYAIAEFFIALTYSLIHRGGPVAQDPTFARVEDLGKAALMACALIAALWFFYVQIAPVIALYYE